MNAHFRILATLAVSTACALSLAGCAAQQAASSGAAPATSSGAATAASSSATSHAEAGSATIDLDYYAGTGYEWAYDATPEGIVELVGHESESSEPEGIDGGSLQDHLTFAALSPGEVVLTFNLVRGWETDEEPADTQIYAFTVTDDLQMILNPYKSDFENEPTVSAAQ